MPRTVERIGEAEVVSFHRIAVISLACTLPMILALFGAAYGAQTGNVSLIRGMATFVAFAPLLMAACIGAVIQKRNARESRPHYPFIAPPCFEAPYPGSISARILTSSEWGASYVGLGWVSLHDGLLSASTLTQSFCIVAQDIRKVTVEQGCLRVFIKERRSHKRLVISPWVNQQGFREASRQAKELALKIKALTASESESTFPAQSRPLMLYGRPTYLNSLLWSTGFGVLIIILMAGIPRLFPFDNRPIDPGTLVALSLLLIALGPLIVWCVNAEAKQRHRKRVELGFPEV